MLAMPNRPLLFSPHHLHAVPSSSLLWRVAHDLRTTQNRSSLALRLHALEAERFDRLLAVKPCQQLGCKVLIESGNAFDGKINRAHDRKLDHPAPNSEGWIMRADS